MERLKNSYWFSHAAHQSKAKVYYGDVYNLPAALGQFDIAVMGSVLLHCRDPLRIVEQCGKMARLLIITDIFYPDLEGTPVCRLAAHSAELPVGYLVAFQHTIFHPVSRRDRIHNNSEFNASSSCYLGRGHTLFTIVAQRSVLKAKWRMLGASRFPAIALWRSNMKKVLRQMIVGTSLEPLARKGHAAFTRE